MSSIALYDALGQQKVAAGVPDLLAGEEVGYVKVTTGWSNLVVPANGDAALSGMTLTIEGDGVNETIVVAKVHGANPGTVTGIHNLRLWDGAVTSGTLIDQMTSQNPVSGSNSLAMPPVIARIPPFLGSKTFNCSWYSGSGGTVPTIHAGTTYPAEMRATRLRNGQFSQEPSVCVTSPLVSGAAQVATSADSTLTWQTELWDTHGMFNPATPERLLAHRSGLHTVSAVAVMDAGVASTERWYIYGVRYNASGVLQEYVYLNSGQWNPSVATPFIGGSRQVNMQAGDYVILKVGQFTGGTRTWSAQGANWRFQLKWDSPNWQFDAESTDTGWLTPTFQNSWAQYGGGAGTFPVAYRRKNGIVYLRGLAASGTATLGTPIFTLPAGFRPGIRHHFGAVSNDLFGSFAVDSNGEVQFRTGSNVWIALNNASFPADN